MFRISAMGHPVHPILQAIPSAVLPASTTFDVLARVSEDDEGLGRAGYYTLVFGLLGAAGAAATGVLDCYEIENRPVRRVAFYRGLSNTALIACYTACLVRRRKDRRADDEALVLSIPLHTWGVLDRALGLPRRRVSEWTRTASPERRRKL